MASPTISNPLFLFKTNPQKASFLYFPPFNTINFFPFVLELFTFTKVVSRVDRLIKQLSLGLLMATTRREGGGGGVGLGKEKRRPSPSPSSSSSSSSSPSKPTTGPRPTTKQQQNSKPSSPNYLKPTRSSRSETATSPSSTTNAITTTIKHVKKVAPGDEQQTSLVRRRSFDNKPPSPSRTQKPGGASGSPNPSLRSASFSSRTTSVTHKLTPKSSTKSQHFTSPKTNKKTSVSPSSTSRRGSPAAKSSVKKQEEEKAGAPQDDQKQERTVDNNADEVSDLGGHDQNEADMKLKPESHEDVSSEMTEAEFEGSVKSEITEGGGGGGEDQQTEAGETEDNDNHYNLESSEISSLISEEPITPVLMEEEEAHNQNNLSNNDGDGDGSVPDRQEGIKVDSVQEAEAEAEAEDQKENIVTSTEKEVASEERTVDVAAEDDQSKPETTEEAEKEYKPEEETTGEEQKAEAEVTEEENKAGSTSETPKHGGGQVYNEVIEETQKKLMETARKNRVLALAGAFQTVIDIEKSNK